MPSPIEFFFDFASPYAYIAAHQVEALAARYGREVDWRPMLLGAVFKLSGSAPLTQQYAPKAKYSLLDFERSTRLAHLPYRLPDPFPIITPNAGRATLWLKREAPDEVGAFVRATTQAYFAHNANINDAAVLREIANQLGLDGAALEAGIAEPAIKDALRAESDEAVARGVFGVPFFFVDGEPFWGQDRMAQIEAVLQDQGDAQAVRGYRCLVDEAMARVKTYRVDEALAKHGTEDVVFVDVRDVRELEREGVIPGALHAPRGMIEFWVDPDSPYYRDSFTPEKEYVFFCAAGWRSALTTRTVQEMGVLPRVAHIEGGFTAWKQAGGPVAEKSKKA